MLERGVLLSIFFLMCLMITFFILFVVAYNKKIVRLENSYERALSKIRQEVQQKMLNNLSFDIIETFGNNLFAIKCNLVGSVLDPLQKITDDINRGFSNPTQEVQTEILKHVLQCVTDIQKNVLDTKQPVDDMNTDVVKTCERLRTNFAQNSLVKNLELELNGITGYEIVENLTGSEYPLGENKEILILWIFQLAINNIVRHSNARHIYIDIQYEPTSFCLCIQDDGVGFNSAEINNLRKKGRGLDNMYNAARMINADITITPRPITGIILTIHLQTLPI